MTATDRTGADDAQPAQRGHFERVTIPPWVPDTGGEDPDDWEPVMPPECDWGWCNGETVAYREEGDDRLPVCQLHLDHQVDAATQTCREDGASWPCEVERLARRSLTEVQAERAHDATKPYPECSR